MPRKVDLYRCLVISPSDVLDEREMLKETFRLWNAKAADVFGAQLEAVMWESHSRPDMGASPQQVLDRQLVEKCDFGIALFWSRLGTPTTKHPSGSVEEIELLLAAGKTVMVYVCKRDLPESKMRDDEFLRLQAQIEVFRKRGLVQHFTDVAGLNLLVDAHLTMLMWEKSRDSVTAGARLRPTVKEAAAPAPDIVVEAGAGVTAGMRPNQVVLSVSVMNRTGSPFHLLNVGFDIEGGSILVPFADLMGLPQFPRDVAANDGYTFAVPATTVLKEVDDPPRRLLCAWAMDTAGRKYSSTPKSLEIALANVEQLKSAVR